MRLVAATRFSFATSPGIDPALYYFAAALHTINYTPTKGIPCHTTLSRSSVREEVSRTFPEGNPVGRFFFLSSLRLIAWSLFALCALQPFRNDTGEKNRDQPGKTRRTT